MQAGLGVGGMTDAYRSEWQRQGSSDVEASTDSSITTGMDHIWKERQKHRVTFARWLPQQAILSDTHTSTVGTSLCSPLTAALRPVCPEPQDRTSYHT